MHCWQQTELLEGDHLQKEGNEQQRTKMCYVSMGPRLYQEIAFWIKRGCLDTIQVCVGCCYLQAILTDAQSLAGLHCISEKNPLASQHNKVDKPK